MIHNEPAILQYTEAHCIPESDLLQALRRETHLKVLKPNMLSGPLQGSVLSMLVHMRRPKTILEIGTFTGYATIWMAQSLDEGNKLYTIDVNEELEDMTRRYFTEAGLQDRIDYRIGNALEVIPTLNVTFDMVFIDADKTNYQQYYDLVFDKVSANGLIIADNVLWKGKVADTEPQKDKRTAIIREFNRYVHNDIRVENVLLPIRDGLMIARKL